MTNEAAPSVESLVRRRRRILVAYLIGWGLWQGTQIVGDVAGHVGPVLLGVQLLSWPVWGVALMLMLRQNKTLRANPALGRALHDEFYQQTRLKAIAVAFGATMAWQAVLVWSVSLSHSLSVLAGADIGLFVGVAAFLGTFLVLERD